MTEKREDPRLNRAQFAVGSVKRRAGEIAKRVGEIRHAMESGIATEAQMSEFTDLTGELDRLRKTMSEIFQKVEEGDQAPHLREV